MTERTVALMFRKPIFYTDAWLAAYAGPLLHTEIVPIDPVISSNTLSFTSFMGRTFSLSISTKNTYSNDTCVALKIPVTVEEYGKLVSYLYVLCENKISYNYKDLLLTALPDTFQNVLLDDVDAQNPKTLKSLFCSQAAVLALRQSLAEDHPVRLVLDKYNSRTMLPYHLYRLLQPFCQALDCNALAHGLIQRRSNPPIL